MSNEKSRYYEAVSVSDETPTKFGMYTWLDSSNNSTCHLPYDPNVEHNFGRFDSWLRPLPPDAVVISGEDWSKLCVALPIGDDLAQRFAGSFTQWVTGKALEIREKYLPNNRSQQNEEK